MIFKGRAASGGFKMDQKDRAKKVPIIKIYPWELKQSGVSLIGKCPLHDDQKPSFVVYPETNSWYCFAEGKGGDVIDLLMQLYNLSFQEAIERLDNGT